jgi:predicted methyltransferase
MFVLALAAVASIATVQAKTYPSYVTKAVADAARPDKDRARDTDRKPVEVMTLSGVKPGDAVADVGPGAGYYTRILSRIVGDKGKVFGFNPTWVAEKFPKAAEGMKFLTENGYPNVEGVVQPMADIHFDRPLDMIYMSQIYHDQVWQKIDIEKMNKAIFNALKPGGVFLIVDHIGRGVRSPEQIDKLHRIDPDLVKEQVLAAGFKLVSESDILRNPYDLGDKNVFDPTIRGHTDQFIFKFMRPK